MTPEPATSDVRTEALHLLSNGVYVLTAAAADYASRRDGHLGQPGFVPARRW